MANQHTDKHSVIAFYAPLKSPFHATPSGDREIARLFMRALELSGHRVELASQLRSYDRGDPQRQLRIEALAKREATRIVKRWQRAGTIPIAWFSYHLYYKAPDLIGPHVAKALNIPYLVAEASRSEKRANGPWAHYHNCVDHALRCARKVICINPVDIIALRAYFAALGRNQRTLESIPVFIDARPCAASPNDILKHKLATRIGLDPHKPWLITIAMMRSGDKFSSYQHLAKSLSQLNRDYQCLIVGSGPCETEVRALFEPNKQVFFAGLLENTTLRNYLPAFDILAWPAINEALGMVFLEAANAGVAVVAGDSGGVSSIVSHGETGLLCKPGDNAAMTQHLETLLDDK
ncbi:MAG: glycosyltransferase family 4 protein, partial [Pseudomonadales bacterium]